MTALYYIKNCKTTQPHRTNRVPKAESALCSPDKVNTIYQRLFVARRKDIAKG
jgi:hypothetical protein